MNTYKKDTEEQDLKESSSSATTVSVGFSVFSFNIQIQHISA